MWRRYFCLPGKARNQSDRNVWPTLAFYRLIVFSGSTVCSMVIWSSPRGRLAHRKDYGLQEFVFVSLS